MEIYILKKMPEHRIELWENRQKYSTRLPGQFFEHDLSVTAAFQVEGVILNVEHFTRNKNCGRLYISLNTFFKQYTGLRFLP